MYVEWNVEIYMDVACGFIRVVICFFILFVVLLVKVIVSILFGCMLCVVSRWVMWWVSMWVLFELVLVMISSGDFLCSMVLCCCGLSFLSSVLGEVGCIVWVVWLLLCVDVEWLVDVLVVGELRLVRGRLLKRVFIMFKGMVGY